MLCSLPMYVEKINIHGTINPNYKRAIIREQEWNEIGKEQGTSAVSTYVSEGDGAKC